MEDALLAVVVSKPRVMRDMPRLLGEAGLRLVDVDAHVYADVGRSVFFLGAAESYAPLVARSGLVPADRVEAWLAGLAPGVRGRRVLRRLQLLRLRGDALTPADRLPSWQASCCSGAASPPWVPRMPDWTKKNFRRLRDQSPKGAPMQWKLARGALRSPELGVSRFTYEPGARMPFGHRHREQEEAYVVVAGSGRAKLDDELVELTAWDVLRVAPAVVRSFEAGPDGLDLICIGGRKPKGGDTERIPDFWD